MWINSKYGKNRYRELRVTCEYDKATRTYVFTPSDMVNYYEIELTQEKTTIISAKDFKRVKRERWCATSRELTEGELWYAVATIGGKKVLMHQFLTNQQYDEVDHINGDGLCNIEENLRDGGGGMNNRNRQNVIGAIYMEYAQCYLAQYYEYDGKQIPRRFYVRNHASKEDARIAAVEWYQTNAERVKQQLERDGSCPEKDRYKPTARSSNSGEDNITDRPYRNSFQVTIHRDGKPNSRVFSYKNRSKEEALQEAIVWRDAFLAANPPKPKGAKKKQKTE